jgi:hypothetical protein
MQNAQEDIGVRWLKLRIKLKEHYGIKPDLDGVLFLIGIQELGAGKQEYTKEQKQDLMHIAICTILAPSGYYKLDGIDEENWPHFSIVNPVPAMPLYEQENFLKDHVLLYFSNLGFI